MDDAQVRALEPFRQRRMAMLALGGWVFRLEQPAHVYWIAYPPKGAGNFIGPSDTLPATIDRAWIFAIQTDQL